MKSNGSERHVLVTGGSRGIGRGVALALAEPHTKIAVHYYRNDVAAKETLEGVRERGSDGILIQADLRCAEDVGRMFAETRAEFGVLDVFVSCARPELADFYRPPLELGLEQWDAAINSQARAFLVGVQSSLPFMRPGGRIVAITYAPGGTNGSWRSWIAMGAAKSALEALCRYFAVALAERGITVNAISPGLTEDTVLKSLPDAVQDAARAWHTSGWTPMRRLGTPADVGRAVALLCSEDAAWITGQLIHVDGGASLMDTVLPLEIQSA